MEEAFGLHRMEKPCPKCAGVGIETFTVRIFPKNGQDVARCSRCNEWIKNLPKTETGKKQRSVSTTHNGVKPAQRARILARANGRCELDGRSAVEHGLVLHVCHFVSVEDGHRLGMTDAEINSDENLFAGCEECNLGMGKATFPVTLAANIVLARLRKKVAKADAVADPEPATEPIPDYDTSAWPIVFNNNDIP